jgi:hypothetical protein
MKLSRLILAALALAPAALATACGSPATAGRTPASYAADDLVLRVRTYGGMVPVAVAVAELPEVSVYGDGRVITTGPVLDMYPGPALPNVQVRHIGRDKVRSLAKRSLEAGVGTDKDLGVPNVADAPATSITVLAESGPLTTSVAALDMTGGDGLSGSQVEARKRLVDLVRSLRDLPKTLGGGAVDEPVAYVPAQLAAIAHRWTEGQGGLPADPPPVDWPGAAPLPGAPAPGRTGVNCLLADAAPVLAAAKAANARTPWVSDGVRWEINFRPLLPDESSCADLTG